MYHKYFDGQGQASLKIVGTESIFEVERKKIADGEDKLLTAQIGEKNEMEKVLQLKFSTGLCQIETEYVFVNSTIKDLTIEVSKNKVYKFSCISTFHFKIYNNL